MHTYSTDSERRLLTIGLLGAVSFAVIEIFKQSAPAVSLGGYALPVVIPSFAVVFGIAFGIYNRHIWRVGVLHTIGLVQVPDLNGEWKGYLKTSYTGDIPASATHPDNDVESEYTKISAKLTIHQRWRNIQVNLDTNQSSSTSEGATLLVDDGRWPTLSYQYKNDPNMESPDSMQLHYGTTNLEFNGQGGSETLEGAYYTGPQRENYGELYFERVDDAD